MNWFTTKPVPKDKDHPLVEDMCEHVEKDFSTAHIMSLEMDSFGPVCSILFCKPCWDQAQKEEGERVVCCQECHTKKPAREMREWKWWDFYAPQGDEALVICGECWKAPRHQARMQRDQKEREDCNAYYRRKDGVYDDDDADYASDLEYFDNLDDEDDSAEVVQATAQDVTF